MNKNDKKKLVNIKISLHHQQRLQASSDDSCCSESDCDAMESTSQCSSSKPHRRQKVGTHTFIQPDILQSPKLVSLATRLNMTPAQQNAFTKALIDKSAGDSSKVNLSCSYADKSRRKISEKIATAVKQTWQAPKLASLHWDSKLVMSLQNQQILEERLTIAVSTKDNIKLLGVPAYKSGNAGNRNSGKNITNLTMDLLDS